jgi:hypothetical protein
MGSVGHAPARDGLSPPLLWRPGSWTPLVATQQVDRREAAGGIARPARQPSTQGRPYVHSATGPLSIAGETLGAAAFGGTMVRMLRGIPSRPHLDPAGTRREGRRPTNAATDECFPHAGVAPAGLAI